MSKIVIIGGGPIGLYLAIKLIQAGIAKSDIIICDPRADEYSRPGHINGEIFAKLNQELHKEKWPSGKAGHIKDVERILFSQVRSSSIHMEKKRFVRFSNDPAHPGVIVADDVGNEETIECSHVFDCSGNQRVVINEVNKRVTPAPFTLKPISSQVDVKNHFLAYVKMSKSDFERIRESLDKQPNNLLSLLKLFSTPDASSQLSPLEHVRAIEKLRAFGWNQFGLPDFHAMRFTKGKVCLYLECPDNLPKEQYSAWVQAVINVTTNSTDITYEQLPPTKKLYSKPRFNRFTVNPMELEQVGYQGEGLPLVIASGDAQIEPNYILGHGIQDGLRRVEQMIEEMGIYKGGIAYFEQDEYQRAVAGQLAEHRKAIIAHYKRRSSNFRDGLEKAELQYSTAIQKVSDLAEKERLETTLIEIRARLGYLKAEQLLTKLHDFSGKISFAQSSTDTLNNYFIEVQDALVRALKDLPASFIKERKQCEEMFLELTIGWKGLGGALFQKKQYAKALAAYEQALINYQHPLLAGKYTFEELVLHSNSILCHKNMDKNHSASALAKHAIEKFPNTPEFLSTRQKIMYNLLRALNDEFKGSITKDERAQWMGFISCHKHLLNESAELERQKLFSDELLDCKENKSELSNSGYSVSDLSMFKKETIPSPTQSSHALPPPVG